MAKRRTTMRHVASAANVSISSVSLVVRGKPGVGSETQQRIWAAISDLGYTLPKVEGNHQKAGVVGLLIEKTSIPVILDAFYGDIIQGFQAEAQRMGYHVVLHMYDATEDTLERLKASLPAEAKGLVVANDGDITPALVTRLQALNIPLVLVESYNHSLRIPCVLGDNFTAGYSVTRHILGLGHRKIAILQGPQKYSSLVDRFRGCLAAAEEEDLLIPRQFLPRPVSGHPSKGYMQMREILWLPDRPTAVIAISDKTAFGAMDAIMESGLRIPDDIAIASIDDVAASAHTTPPLTTVKIPRHEIGGLAMQQMHRLINDEHEIAAKSVAFSELVIRASCGAAGA